LTAPASHFARAPRASCFACLSIRLLSGTWGTIEVHPVMKVFRPMRVGGPPFHLYRDIGDQTERNMSSDHPTSFGSVGSGVTTANQPRPRWVTTIPTMAAIGSAERKDKRNLRHIEPGSSMGDADAPQGKRKPEGALCWLASAGRPLTTNAPD